jgi:hypothetical protein
MTGRGMPRPVVHGVFQMADEALGSTHDESLYRYLVAPANQMGIGRSRLDAIMSVRRQLERPVPHARAGAE